MNAIALELFRIAPTREHRGAPIANLQLPLAAAPVWLRMMDESRDISTAAGTAGIACIKLHTELSVLDARLGRRQVGIELEFFGDSVKVRVPRYEPLTAVWPPARGCSLETIVARNWPLARRIAQPPPRPKRIAEGLHVS